MKKLLFTCLAIVFAFSSEAQTSFTTAKDQGKAALVVHYLDNYPFAYQNEQGQLTGLEIDVVMAFADWLMRVKEIKLSVEFVPYTDFAKVYEKIKGAPDGQIGLASATVTRERQKEVLFTPPYLKNVSMLVTNIDVPTLRAYSDMPVFFENMTALVMRGTVLEAHLLDVRKKHFEKMRVSYVEHPKEVVQQIAETNKQYFGYVDILTYWSLLKQKPANLKIHRVASLGNQFFGLMLPKESSWAGAWAEFMEGGFGFPATETYYNILQRHLSYEVIETVSMP
jgi:ABC-type amino acid transport substrate-binding protein